MAGRRILITGIASYLGTELARRLEQDPDVEYVAGLDTRKPKATLENTEFIEADIRSPVIARLIAPTKVDTIVHNQIVRRPAAERISPRAAHDIHVIGSLQPARPVTRLDRLCPRARGMGEARLGAPHRHPWVRRHLRRRAGSAAVLHRGH